MVLTMTKKLTTQDIAFMGMAVAIIEACKMVMQGLPNIEVTSFFVILFTLVLGSKMLLVVPALHLSKAVSTVLASGGLCTFMPGLCWHLSPGLCAKRIL